MLHFDFSLQITITSVEYIPTGDYMKKEDILYVTEEINKILNLTEEQHKDLIALSCLDFKNKKNSEDYKKTLKHYKTINELTETIYKRLYKPNYIIIADKMLTDKLMTTSLPDTLPANSKSVAIIKVQKRIYELADNVTNRQTFAVGDDIISKRTADLSSTIIRDFKCYDLITNLLYCMNKYKKENQNEYIKNKLNYGMYYYTFIHDYVEQEVSKRDFNFNNNLLLITDLVASKYNIPSFMYKIRNQIVFTESLASHIREVEKFKTLDLKDAENKICVYIHLAYMKSLCLILPKELIKQVFDNLNTEDPLIKSILVKSLTDALSDKKKVITFKRTIN